MPEILVGIRGLVVRYGERVALEVERLSVRRGEIVALLGPNGSGKTTLLKALAGLVPASSGEIVFDGRPLAADDPRFARRVYVHQSPYLLAGSVYRNVALALRGRPRGAGTPDREATRRRVEEVLGSLALEGFQHRDARKLSGGEGQRVAVARALALSPELLLLDEPTAAADAASRPLIVEAVRVARDAEGLTVILSSHDEASARALADRVVRVEDGRILDSAETPEERT